MPDLLTDGHETYHGCTDFRLIVMYEKAKSKVETVKGIANELPVLPVAAYLLCDSWYTCGGIMDAFIKKGFYTIGALKTNRVLYPCVIKQKVSEFALRMEPQWH